MRLRWARISPWAALRAYVGMTELFGVVRVDNPEGLALMSKMGAQALDRVQHFGQEAQVFRINLKAEGSCRPAL
jgi:hypothetical protein